MLTIHFLSFIIYVAHQNNTEFGLLLRKGDLHCNNYSMKLNQFTKSDLQLENH